MASSVRRSGIPVKSTVPKSQTGGPPQATLSQGKPSSIPIKKTKKVDATKSPNSGPPDSSQKKEDELQEEIKRLESEVKDKDSAINDLNEKLMKGMKECQVLREENEAARENLNLSSDHQVSGKIKDLEKLLNEKETFIENMLTNKDELERKFEVELDMLKNQHEIEVLSLEQRLEDAHQEKLGELETSLSNEKSVSGRLREELKGVRDQSSSAEINLLHEELMSTKLRYENTIFGLKQELEKENSEKENVIIKQEADRKEIDSIKEKHREEMETLKYLVQEKDILITDLKSGGEKKSQDMKLCSNEDVTTKLEELRRELTVEHEHNLELANELWRKKFEEHRSSDSDRTKKDNDEHQSNENTDKLLDEISDLKEQLQEANELHEEQTEILEIQEKEIEELKESNKEFEERYTTLFKEMESKWQSEFSESEIIEKIKSHYEMEVDRLHGDLEDLQNENSNLKTELDLVTNDFDGGHSRASGGAVRRPSVTARIDMKAEIEDYKVQLGSLERDLQHALNQNERLKLESSVKNGATDDSNPGELNTFTNKVLELEQEREKLLAERDDFRAKFEENKKERKKVERDLKSRTEEKTKIQEELKSRDKEMVSLNEEHTKRVKMSEAEVLEMKANVDGLTSKYEIAENELKSTRESLSKSENRKRDLEQTLEDLKDKDVTRTQEFEEAKSKISTLEKQLNKMDSKRDRVGDQSKEVKVSKESQQADPRIKVTELENMLAQVKLANEALKVKYDKILSENETKISRIRELEVAVSQGKTDFENSEVNHEKVENDTNQSGIDEVESRLNQVNKEYESLTRKYDDSVQENESKSLQISKVETLFRQKIVEYEKLSAKCDELRKKNESSESRIAELEAVMSEQKSQFDTVECLSSNLQKESAAMTSKINELENLLRQSKDECAQFKRNNENLAVENKKTTSRASQLEASLDESKVEYQKLNENYQNILEESNTKVSKTDKLEKDGTQLRKQIAAFEKKVAMQEREKKALEEKISSLDKTIEIQKSDILNLKEKCDAHDWRNKELDTQLEALRNVEETVKTYKDRNEELLAVIEEATREKSALLVKQARLLEENKELRGDRDTLQDERNTLKNEKDTLKNEMDTLKDKMDTMRDERDTLKDERDTLKNELDTLKDEMDTLRDERDTLKDERDTMKDEMDTLKDERGLYENEREHDSSEHGRKLETAQKKLKEKDRVLNETKKHYRQLKESEKQLKERINKKEQECMELEAKIEELNEKLKRMSKEKEETRRQHRDLEESFEEKNKRCLELEEKLEQMHRKFTKENTKIKQLLEETKNASSVTEQALQEEISQQKINFARELENMQENMNQSAEIEISRLTQELQVKLGNNEETRRDTSRLSEENHTLKIKLDDLGIAVSKEKEEKYKVEKLKDNFRFQVQGLQERLEAEQEKISVLQNEHLRGEKKLNKERNKLLETLNEYEAKNTKLISDIDKASSVLKTTKEKYMKLKEKYTSLAKKYTTIAKKYTTLNEEKLNKSDVLVGPDTSVDLSLIVEDLQRSKETAEETNYKLRADLDRLREEIGRSEYQVKAVRKANVVLMKQSRCLYHESEEQKRLDEEKSSELHKYREIKETLQEEKDTWTKEREMLENRVRKFEKETAKLKQENEEYFMTKNKTEIELGEKASECVLHSRQLERLKSENEFLYQQGRKLQAELDVIRMKSITRTTIKSDENHNYFPGFDKELTKHRDPVGEMGTIKDFGTGKLSFGSRLSESTNSLIFDEGRISTPLVFNNEKIVGDKVIENSNKNRDQSSPPLNKTYSAKDTNLQISRNIINNDFASEKYLGKTYWDTLEFLKKK